MYGCESWTTKKAEHRRIDAFELWCWRRLLRAPWTASRSNQSILKEISSEYSLEGLMLKLKLQYFCYLMWITNSFEKTLMLRKIEDGGERDNREWDGWMASPTQWIWVWVSSGSLWWIGWPGVLLSLGSKRVEDDWATEVTEILLLLKVWVAFEQRPERIKGLSHVNIWGRYFQAEGIARANLTKWDKTRCFWIKVKKPIKLTEIVQHIISLLNLSPVQFSSVELLSRVQLCDPMGCSTPGIPVHHQLPELIQTHVSTVSQIKIIIPSHPFLHP